MITPAHLPDTTADTDERLRDRILAAHVRESVRRALMLARGIDPTSTTTSGRFLCR